MSAEAHKGLLDALLAFQDEVPTLPKDGHNPHFKSRFTPLDTIVEVVGPLLVKHGLVWTALPCRDQQGDPALRYRLAHAASGQVIEDTMPLLLSKADPQGQGSALTYARRYSLSAVLNLVSDEDDDGNSASRQQAARRPAADTGPLASDDVQFELVQAAKGLKIAQVKLALTACGVPLPEPFTSAAAFTTTPAAKAPELMEALKGSERQS